MASPRREDLLLIAIGLGWLLRTAYHHRKFGIIRTPPNGPIVAYFRSRSPPLSGRHTVRRRLLFHNLKYFEYFPVLHDLAHVRDEGLIRRLDLCSLVVFGPPPLRLHPDRSPVGASPPPSTRNPTPSAATWCS
jgi:hypothetical protein